jgi:porin
MDSKGIDFSMIWTGVYQQNLSGGVETHNAEAFPGDFRMNLTLDFDKMGLIPGGFLFVRGKSMWTGGIRPDVGSLKSTSWALDGGCEPFFADKYWYGQYFLDKKIEFRIGKLLTPDLFDNAAYASDLPWDQFMNENLAINSTVPHRKSLGAYVKVRPTDWLYFGTGATDADQRDATRCIGFDTTFHDDTQYFVGMWELGLTPSFKTDKGLLPGNYKFGWWYDPRVKTIYKDPKRDRYRDTTVGDDVGFYTTMDQLVWKETADPKDKQGLGMFLRYGFAHREVNRIAHFWSIGAQYEGLLPGRNGDVLAFGVAQNIMSTQYRYYVNELADRETVYEAYYAIKLTPWCVITPDIQVITNPGGNQNARDSFIGGLRVKITF